MGRRRIHKTVRDRVAYSRYGITGPEREAMERAQMGRCMICSEVKLLVTDHSHKTDVVRGLLCHECNLGLGKFRDNARLLRRAAAYLEAYNTTHPNPHELLLNLRKIGAF